MSRRGKVILKSGTVLDLALCGTPCEITCYGGEKRVQVIVGTFTSRWRGRPRIHVATAEALSAWTGDPATLPGISFPESVRRSSFSCSSRS